jgi:hypothetical protein
MKKKSTSQSAFFNVRVLIAALFCLAGVAVALFGMGAFSNVFAQPKSSAGVTGRQDAPGTQTPEVMQLVGPVVLNTDLRDLPYIPPAPQIIKQRLIPHSRPQLEEPAQSETSAFPQFQSLLAKIFRQMPNMPPPLLTFDGTNSSTSGCGCLPPDTDGDVGPNHYVQTVNIGFRVFDKSGNPLAPFTTYQSFFAPLVGTPCQNQNQGDPFVFYDHLADRWVVSDFAFVSYPGTNFYECIGVSQSPDPVAGPWALYALLVDPANLDDYPKLAMWNNPQPGGAYYLAVSLFDSTGNLAGNRVIALDRGSMLTGGPANAINFMIPGAAMPVTYHLMPASFRTGNPPPAGRDEFLLAIDSPANGGVVQTQVHGWLFHADFVNPGNSTFGIGPDHTPNQEIAVNSFVDACNPCNTAAGYHLVPQQGTTQKLDTLGDGIMIPLAYQNRAGTESLWADHTVLLNFPNGPTAIRWYQMDVTGGNLPATAVQQQDWSNGNDGLFRWMPSIAVDQNGNTAIGYSTSSPSIFPGIRYAGRLESDPPGNLAQGEAVMTNGGGAQTHSSGRWGDYSMNTIDPADGMTFWHTNEYYPTTSSASWFTRVGKFNFQGGVSPTPTPTATPTSCSWSAGPNLPNPPATLVRAVGVYFPDGNFYSVGGRTSDAAGSDFQHVLQYNPNTNSWTQMGVTLPDNQMNNMACGVLTVSGAPYIYCVGGSAATQTTATARVFFYDPATDTVTTLTAGDNWPGDLAGTILPGGFAVTGNKLYILGGFNINVASTNEIWQFDPTAGVGSKWLQKVNTPEGVMYAPTCAINGIIYVGGASDWDGTTVIDTTNSFSFDPGTNTIGSIAAIPRATGETRGLTFCNKMYVMGGGRVAPNPSNEVDVYDPGTNTWSTGLPFVNARRNFPTDTDGTNNIWLAGGYEPSTPAGDMEIFNCPVSPCSSPSPTPTATATATATATPTPTPTSAPRATPTPRPRPTPAPRP